MTSVGALKLRVFLAGGPQGRLAGDSIPATSVGALKLKLLV